MTIGSGGPTVLLAEHDRAVTEAVAFGVRMAAPTWRLLVAPAGPEALRVFRAARPDLAILDLGAEADGLTLCRHLRQRSRAPILALAPRHSTLDTVRALDAGADDCLPQPFDPLELLARLRALLRRAGPPTGRPLPPDLVVGDLALSPATREVRLRGEPVPLTATEYRLLEEMMRHAGRVLPHRELVSEVWGPVYAEETHYLKGVIRRLRRKLGDGDPPRRIQTVWGSGYRLVPIHTTTPGAIRCDDHGRGDPTIAPERAQARN